MRVRRAVGTGAYYLTAAAIVLGLAVCLFYGPILEWLDR